MADVLSFLTEPLRGKICAIICSVILTHLFMPFSNFHFARTLVLRT